MNYSSSMLVKTIFSAFLVILFVVLFINFFIAVNTENTAGIISTSVASILTGIVFYLAVFKEMGHITKGLEK